MSDQANELLESPCASSVIEALAAETPIRIQPNANHWAKLKTLNIAAIKQANANLALYGYNRGVGPERDNLVSTNEQVQLARQILSYGCRPSGSTFPEVTVRCAVLVRILTLINGSSGISPSLVQRYLDTWNQELKPSIRRAGSIGAGDLGELGQLARYLLNLDSEVLCDDDSPSDDSPFEPISIASLGPRDPLALVSSNAFSLAESILLANKIRFMLTAQTSALVLSLYAFGGSLSPFSSELDGLRQWPALQSVHTFIRKEASLLVDWKPPRHLQDPLSFRSAGSVIAVSLQALWDFEDALEWYLRGGEDNPSISEVSGRPVNNDLFDTSVLGHYATALSSSILSLGYLSFRRLHHLGVEVARKDDPKHFGHPQSKYTLSLMMHLEREAIFPNIVGFGEIAQGIEDWASGLPQRVHAIDKGVDYAAAIITEELQPFDHDLPPMAKTVTSYLGHPPRLDHLSHITPSLSGFTIDSYREQKKHRKG